jgi:hypothetical protein
MTWCEENGVEYVAGFASNGRLRRYQTTTGSWSRARRLVAKAGQLEGRENPRYVVTKLSAEQWPA